MLTTMLTTAQAAAALSISRSRVLKLIAAGRLPAVKIGRDWLIQPQDLELVRVRRPGRPRALNRIDLRSKREP